MTGIEVGTELGDAVRRHRLARGMTGTEVASGVGVRQGTISKIERGRLVPDLDFLAKFAHTLRLSRDDAQELMRLAGAVPGGVTPDSVLQYLPADFLSADWSQRRQETVAAAESCSKAFSVFNPLLVPGLLQTESYARCVLQAAGLPDGKRLDQAVRARRKRQGVLDSPRRRVSFLVTETALVCRVAPAAVLVEQLRWLTRWCGHPCVSLGVIPTASSLQVLPPPAFYLFEHKVYVELPHGDLWLMERSNALGTYRGLLPRLAAAAVYGSDCAGLLHRLASSL